MASTEGTSERAVDGVTSGLIGTGQTVTWEARHLGFTERMTVRITKLQRPEMFEDEMVAGPFKRMHHRHEFVSRPGGSEMIDIFEFSAPFGILGRLAEMLFLRAYLARLLRSRAIVLKRLAESDGWRNFVPES